MVLVSVTRLHLVSPRYFSGFLWHTALSSWQIINIPGFLGGKLAFDKQGGSWTMSIWETESAMRQYRNSGAHRQAMRYLPRWCDEAAVVHWQQEDTTLPEASEAYRRMVSEGHFTKVLQPSDNQQKRQIPEPASPKGVPLHPRKKSKGTASQYGTPTLDLHD